MKQLNIYQLLGLIEEPNRSACKSVLLENKKRFSEAPGSLAKHQAWSGGYIDHLKETMNFGLNLFEMMNSFRKLEFIFSDVLLVLFLHDLEKPFRYIEPVVDFHTDHDKELFIRNLISKHGFVLNENHWNALKYIHGEGNDYSRTERIQGPLAAFCHICDVASARIWFDYPKNSH